MTQWHVVNIYYGGWELKHLRYKYIYMYLSLGSFVKWLLFCSSGCEDDDRRSYNIWSVLATFSSLFHNHKTGELS